MEYLIDSNALIDAYNKWYNIDNFPSIWNEFSHDPDMIILESVYNEINRQNDGLSEWLVTYFKKRKVTPSSDEIAQWYKIITWLKQERRWGNSAIQEWSDPEKADPLLIANAIVNNRTIVTFDGANRNTNLPQPNQNSKKEPKISRIAHVFNVDTISVYDFVRTLNLKL